jgi:hypothetical protein
MKVVVLMCVEEFVEDARKLLKEQKVPAFSEVGMQGYKLEEPDESDNWFASKHYLDNSHVFFSMIEDKKADELMAAINVCKENKKLNSVHAFQLAVERFIG